MHQPDYLSILKEERSRILNTLRQTSFSKLDPLITHNQIIPFASYSPWKDDDKFLAIYEKISKHTLVDIYRCYELWSIGKQMRSCAGDILEVGVWRGGTAGILGISGGVDAKLFLADTFAGVIKAGDHDTIYKGGEHADTSPQIVNDLLQSLGVINHELLIGIFPDEFLDFSSSFIKICHIDVDTFLSAKGIMDFIWPRMIKGGIVIFDDYGFFGCEGVTKFVNQLDLTDSRIIYNLNGHGLVIKL